VCKNGLSSKAEYEGRKTKNVRMQCKCIKKGSEGCTLLLTL